MKKRIHYCWLILAACCMVQGTGFGIINNCTGLYYNPISQDLGFSIGSISLYTTISNLSCCAMMLFVNRLLEKFDERLVLTLGVACASFPQILMSMCSRLWQWYALAVVQGVGLAFSLNLVIPVILNNWFRKKNGLVLGISSACTGIFGAIMSVVLGRIIAASSWRAAYRVAGVTGLILTVPMCLFVLRMKPETLHMRPYGDSGEGETTPAQPVKQPMRTVFKDRYIWILVLIAILARSLTTFIAHLAVHGKQTGFSVMDVSLIVTINMIGIVVAKLTFGQLNDRLGLKKSSYLGLAIAMTSLLLLRFGREYLLAAGAFLFSTTSMLAQVEVPLLCRKRWKSADYASVMVVVNVACQLAYSVCVSGIGFSYDLTGNYHLALGILMAFVCVITALTALFLRGAGKRAA